MQLIKAFHTETVIQGMTKRVVISIETQDETEFDFSYWDQDLAKKTMRDLNAGRVGLVWVKVTARFSDLAHFEGVDSLGQVFVRASKDLAEKDVLQTVNDHAMTQNAIDELVKETLSGVSQIEAFLGKAA